MSIAKFESTGGPLSAEVTLSETRDGSYDLVLWHPDLNQQIKSWSGNFRNTDDDRYSLPTPPSANHGRFLEGRVVLAVPVGVNPCVVSLVVRQQDTEIGRDTQTVPPGSSGKWAQLWVDLVEEGGE